MNWPWSSRGDVLGINRRNLDLVFAEYRPGKFRDLDDKLLCKVRLEEAKIPVPRTLAVISSTHETGMIDEVLNDRDELVIKPARGSRGRGILVLMRDQDHWRTPGNRHFDVPAIHDHIDDILSGAFSLDEAEDRALIEARIHPDRWIRSIYPSGLSDLRVVVENQVPLQAMLRVPTDASDGKANLHEGGIGIGVDLESGRTVHAVQKGTVVSRHPDTAQELIGHLVPDFERCLVLAREVAEAYPEILYIGVDLVLDEERGPLVLEVNARPGLAIQVANQQPQRVGQRTRVRGFDRVTQQVAWLILVLLGVAPLAYGMWRGTSDTIVEPVRTGRPESARGNEDGVPEGSVGLEWSDASEPVSDRDDRFAGALAAVAAGDTTRGLMLYGEASLDSSLTPFALNNIALIRRARGNLVQAREDLRQAVLLYDSYARGHYNLGLVERDLGNLSGAKQSFHRAVELRPSYSRAWSRLGNLYLQEESWQQGVEALEQAIRFDPDRIADRRSLGRAHLFLQRPGAAAKRYEEALALSPGSTSARSGYLRARLAQLALSDSDPTDATLDSLDERLAAAFRRSRRNPELVALGAELSWWKGDPRAGLERIDAFPEAELPLAAISLRSLLELEIGLFDRVLARDPAPGLERLHDLARWGRYLEVRGGQVAEAAPAINASLDPVVRTLALRATGAAVNVADLEAAREGAVDVTERSWVQRAVGATREWDPRRTPARIHHGGNRIYRPPLPTPVLEWCTIKLGAAMPGDLDETYPNFVPRLRERFAAEVDTGTAKAAHKLGMRLLHNLPEDSDVLVALVRLELDRDKPGLGRSLFDRIPASAKRRPDVRLIEARLLLAEAETRAARRVLEDLLRQDPAQVEALEILAATELAERRPRAAAAALEKALLIRPDRQDLREQLARALMDQRKYSEAEAEWRRLSGLENAPGLTRSVLFNLALCIQRQGRDEDAIAAWNELLSSHPDYARAHFNLALALERLGRVEEAVAGYRRALELDPAHESSRARLAELTNGKPGEL